MAGPLPFETPKKEEKHHSSFFSKHQVATPATNINELSTQISGISRRMRLIEERYITLRKKTQLSDQTMLGIQKEIHRNSSSLTEEMTELRKELNELRDTVRLIIKELKDCAKSDEVKILDNYINMWQPMDFVTKKEVARIIEEILNERLDSE